jgi:hypothetical protein
VAILALSDAAKAAGCSRQHLYRLVSKGRLSAVLRADGTRGIDTSELLRVFGQLAQPATGEVTGDSRLGDNRRQQVTGPVTSRVEVLEVELRAAQDALRVADERLREAQAREERLLELVAAQTRMLEHKTVSAPPPPADPPEPEAPPRVRRTEGFDFSAIPSFADLAKPRRRQ